MNNELEKFRIKVEILIIVVSLLLLIEMQRELPTHAKFVPVYG